MGKRRHRGPLEGLSIILLLAGLMIRACAPLMPVPPTPSPLPAPPTPTRLIEDGTYYVSPAGDDANPGTVSQPWRTIQKAADTLTGGATIIVQAGEYDERVAVTHSGRAGAPNIFQAQGQVTTRGFTLRADYVVIRGFDITRTLDNSIDGWGIFVEGSHCLLENNYIHDATRGGIELYAVPGSEDRTSECVVRGNRLYRNSQVGIDARGYHHLIEGNEIWGTIQHHPSMAVQPNWVDADGIHFHGSGHIIRGNYIHDILYSDPANVDPHIDCFQTFAAAPYKEPGSNVVFEQNRCVNAQATGTQKHGSGFMINGASGITIRNNLINAYVGVNALYSSQLTIVNNTFTSDLSLSSAFYPAGITFTSVSDSTVQNNILYDQPGHLLYLSSVTGLSAGKNLEYRSDGKPLWTTPSYAHADDLWGIDPRFVAPGDYHLQAGSPAVDAGYAVPVTNDYEGRPRPQGQGYDIGALEYSP